MPIAYEYDGPRVSIETFHHYPVPPEAVFHACITPALAAKWLFATKTGKTTTDLDPRTGGKYTITRTSGKKQYVATGEYLEVDSPRRLAFTFGMPQFAADFDTVTITVAPVEGGSKLHLRHEGLRPGYEKSTISGWEKMLGLLDSVLKPAPGKKK